MAGEKYQRMVVEIWGRRSIVLILKADGVVSPTDTWFFLPQASTELLP